jgi:membrane protein CcdC involved in cytochrome C biogenesis
MQQAGSRAVLVGGLRPRVYLAALALLAVVTSAMAGLLIRAIATGELAGILFLVGFAALFGWQVGGFVRRNRPQIYSFDDLPGELLP